jgi:O-antigen ligase
MIKKSTSTFMRNYQFFWFSVLFVGLLYWGTLQILAMLMLLLPSFIILEFSPFKIRWNKNFFQSTKDFIANRSFWLITLVFWVSLFSVFNSKNLDTWWFFTSMKLPFLLFTFAVYALPQLSKKTFQQVILVYVLILFFSSFQVLLPFFDRQEELRQLIAKGHSIPTPIDHIKYSLFLSFGIITSLMLVIDRGKLFFKGEKILLTLVLIYLFIFIHLLAVRSGILILYINLAVYGLTELIRRKKYLLGGLTLAIILSIPLIAYLVLPTFRAKVQYSIRDFQMSSQNKEMDYSDGERLRSYQIGWEMFEDSPITGFGVGDVFDEYAERYENKFYDTNPTFLPHNQFLTIAVSTGIVGLLFFSLSFFFPFLYKEAWKDPFLKALFILMLLSFLVENTLERQYSVGFYLVFLLLGLKQYFNGKVSG